jgi:hypothetical protein
MLLPESAVRNTTKVPISGVSAMVLLRSGAFVEAQVDATDVGPLQ